MTDDTEHEYDYPMGSGAGLGQCSPEQVRAATQVPSQVPSREQELEAQCAAMREALELDGQLEGFDCPHDAEHRCRCGEIEKDLWARYHAARDRALAIDAGKALLEWKESAMRALGEWHEARELIGGAQLGDGPVEWARRVKERLEDTERNLSSWQGIARENADLCRAAEARADKAERERDAYAARNIAWQTPPAMLRAQALEEAAKACDFNATFARQEPWVSRRVSPGVEAEACAAAIRALKDGGGT